MLMWVKNLFEWYLYTIQFKNLQPMICWKRRLNINLKTFWFLEPPLKEGVDAETAKPKSMERVSGDPYIVAVNFSNVFSDKYGEIIQYTVIVMEEKNYDMSRSYVLPGWKEARQNRSIKAYQVISALISLPLPVTVLGDI